MENQKLVFWLIIEINRYFNCFRENVIKRKSNLLILILSEVQSLHKIYENTGFHRPVFSPIRRESAILSLYGWSMKTRILAYFME